jgi:PAS domain S-box-containing protein
MKLELRILHLEDNPDDAELIEMLLTDQGVACEIERVDTREGFIAALDRGQFDLILSDFSLPAFDGVSALELAREKRSEVPFLFVSGTLGEEVAINALKSGATDYILKQRMTRLGAAVSRAVADAQERQALQRAETAMIQSEFKYRQLFECLSEAALLADAATNRVLDTNRQAEILLDRTRAEILGLNVKQLLSPATIEEYQRRLTAPGISPDRVAFEGEILCSAGRAIPVTVSASPILLHGRRLILGLYRDVSERKRTELELQRLKDQLALYTGNTGTPAGERTEAAP